MMKTTIFKHKPIMVSLLVLSCIFLLHFQSFAEEISQGADNHFDHTYCGDLSSIEDVRWCLHISVDYTTQEDTTAGIIKYIANVNQEIEYYDRNTNEILSSIQEKHTDNKTYSMAGRDPDGSPVYRINDVIKEDIHTLVDLGGECIMHDLVWHKIITYHIGAVNEDNLFHTYTPIISSDILCD
jgi:hypothetical protein